jgi:saccharopine dehydrogenase-like NADP-dependent oxidoreductase
VIEIYTRPARLVRGGAIVTVPALTELEQIDFPEIGQLDAFNTDGLRTFLRTTSIPELTEKTLRYPGLSGQVTLFASAGFFDEEREVNGALIYPREVSAQLLTEQWLETEDDHDVTVMRLELEGERSGKPVRVTYDLCDRFDRQRGISSMARTTGYPCPADRRW